MKTSRIFKHRLPDCPLNKAAVGTTLSCQVWAMKREELGVAVRGLLAADRVMQERCLGGGNRRSPSAAADLASGLLPSCGDVIAVTDSQRTANAAVSGEVAAPAESATVEVDDDTASDTADGSAFVTAATTSCDDLASAVDDSSAADANTGATMAATADDTQDSSVQRRGSRTPDRSLWRQLGEVIDKQRYKQWRSAEQQLQQYFALLQARAAAAVRIKQLKTEHEHLREAVEQLRTDPINQHLQLPPSLFLNSSLSALDRVVA